MTTHHLAAAIALILLAGGCGEDLDNPDEVAQVCAAAWTEDDDATLYDVLVPDEQRGLAKDEWVAERKEARRANIENGLVDDEAAPEVTNTGYELRYADEGTREYRVHLALDDGRERNKDLQVIQTDQGWRCRP